jgi:hypothetical protein
MQDNENQQPPETIPMQVVHPFAAGIDVGSRSHWVAVGQAEGDIREFGVFNENLFDIARWLKDNHIKTVAMESTGTYWQSLYAVLIAHGFEVMLCNGKFTKNIKGKKTDIKDCQWIQKLHTLGLLSGSFLPDPDTEQLRTYCRHRENLLHNAASTAKKMQKYLRLLNLRLDVVVNDICGLTGLQIIRAKQILKNWPPSDTATAAKVNRKLPPLCNPMAEKTTSLHLLRNWRPMTFSKLKYRPVMCRLNSNSMKSSKMTQTKGNTTSSPNHTSASTKTPPTTLTST